MSAQLLFSLLILTSCFAMAFPENIRHGYMNCTSCHVSPSGGGALTKYGRSLSSELMSTWSYKGEEGVLHGLANDDKIPEWLSVGGDLRGAQLNEKTDTETNTQWLRMQAEVEAAFRIGKVILDSTIGIINMDEADKRWGSRRYFMMYNFSDELTARVGRFYPQFGIMLPDHYVSTRHGLGFGDGHETDNLEVAWNGELWGGAVTAVQSRGETAKDQREQSLAVQVDRNLLEKYKIGMNGWVGGSDLQKRQILGVHGILGFSKTLSLLTEFDQQWLTTDTSGNQRGWYTFNRLAYECYKGFNVFVQAESEQSDSGNYLTAADGYGPGIQFFPRPHFEIFAILKKTRVRSDSNSYGDFGFLLAHYYF